MHAQTIFVIVASAAVASAGNLRTRAAAAQCGNGQVLACCNSKGSNTEGGLLDGVLQGVLGGNCDQLPINVIGANGILDQACGSNAAACCSGNMNGLINIACDPIVL